MRSFVRRRKSKWWRKECFSDVDVIQSCMCRGIPLEEDDAHCFYPGSTMTKGEAARAMIEFCEKQKFTHASEEQYIRSLLALYPDAKIPGSWTTTGTYISELHQYKTEEKGFISFDVCPRSCGAFVGSDASRQQCPKCKTARFRAYKCASKNCIGAAVGMCQHYAVKSPYRRLFYLSLLQKMKMLINQTGFLIALQYVRPVQTTATCSHA